MPKLEDIRELKQAVSAKIRGIPGVAGVGVVRGTLTVYLAYDSPSVRTQVVQIVHAVAPSTRVDFVVTGPFEAQGGI